MIESDRLPKQLCTKCIISLTTAYSFKVQCEKSDEVLKEFFNTNFENAIAFKNDSEPKINTNAQDLINDDSCSEDFVDNTKKKCQRVKQKKEISNATCSICNRHFSSSGSLNRHSKVSEIT